MQSNENPPFRLPFEYPDWSKIDMDQPTYTAPSTASSAVTFEDVREAMRQLREIPKPRIGPESLLICHPDTAKELPAVPCPVQASKLMVEDMVFVLDRSDQRWTPIEMLLSPPESKWPSSIRFSADQAVYDFSLYAPPLVSLVDICDSMSNFRAPPPLNWWQWLLDTPRRIRAEFYWPDGSYF